jgi:hypothetical protein
MFGTSSSDQTERAMAGQLVFAFGSLIVLVVVAGIWPVGGRAIGWTVMTICCASLVGVLMGLLFGLPTQRIEIARAAGPITAGETRTADPQATGNPAVPAVAGGQIVAGGVPYVESTSLEQVADWLTKIIIGVTLTQYASWERHFFALSVDVTANLNDRQLLLGRCIQRLARPGQSDDQRDAAFAACARLSGGAIPGGLLMLTFATLGFLVAYLWMRRYFIIEMVVARNAAIDKMRAARRAEEQVQLAIAATEQVKLTAALDQARQEAADIRTQLDQARRAAEDKVKVDFAERTKTLQLDDGTGDADYAIAALTRASQLLPNNESAPVVCQTMIEQLRSAAVLPYPDDPWRALFGGDAQSAADNVRLGAAVTPLASDANLFEVVLTIAPIDHADPVRLSGQQALFFLHPTFGKDPRPVSFDARGEAVLRLISYGAFTVGVILENGHQLELNLAEVPGAPEMFRVK